MAQDSSQRLNDSEFALKECDAIEAELAALKAMYEQYFLGMERLPPLKAHERLKKRLKALKDSRARSTSAKFRVNNLGSKFLTYERLWEKSLKERESGTYRRDVERARRRTGSRQELPAEQRNAGPATVELRDDLDFGDEADALLSALEEVATPAAPPRPPAAAVPAAAPVPPASVHPPVAAPPLVPPGVARPAAPLPPSFRPPTPGAPAGIPAVPSLGTVAPVVPAAGARTVPPPGQLRPAALPPVPPVGSSSPTLPGGPAAPRPAGTVPVTTFPTGAAPRPPVPAPPGLRPTAPVPPAMASAAPAAPRASTPAAPGPGVSDAKLKAVYDAYMTAKRRCNEDTSSLNYDRVAGELRRQVSDLMRKEGAKAVEFKVVIRDGKAELRTLPKS